MINSALTNQDIFQSILNLYVVRVQISSKLSQTESNDSVFFGLKLGKINVEWKINMDSIGRTCIHIRSIAATNDISLINLDFEVQRLIASCESGEDLFAAWNGETPHWMIKAVLLFNMTKQLLE